MWPQKPVRQSLSTGGFNKEVAALQSDCYSEAPLYSRFLRHLTRLYKLTMGCLTQLQECGNIIVFR